MKKFLKKIGIVFLVLFLMVMFWDDEEDEVLERIESDETWSVLVYLCGSDLESEAGLASDDLEEIMSINYPENVNIIIQTGGAETWENDFVSDERMQRYVYGADGLELVDESPLYNMGDSNTLASFLGYASVHYPADHTAVIIWNHGGGSVSGVAFDELYNDSLDINELRNAFETIYDLSSENPPIDIIGFDACLMATIDVAASFKDVARYMVASEDLIPGFGWDYAGWLKTLSYNPGIDPKDLAINICDSYYDFYEDWGMEDEITLSVVDLSKIDALLASYDFFGQEAFVSAYNDPNFLVRFARNANEAENYGGNNRYDGYTNMVDLGSLALRNQTNLPDSTTSVINALNECVVYKVAGEYRENASGLSCYYSFNGDMDDFMGYREVGCSESFINYYNYSLGNLDYIEDDYLEDFGFDIFDFLFPTDLSEIDPSEFDVYLNEDNCAVLDVGLELADMVADVYYNVSYFDVEDGTFILLGSDDVDLDADFDNGVFVENFDNSWGAIDGHYIYTEVIGYGDNYYKFVSPILVNGREAYLHIIFDFNSEEYKILGYTQGINDYGMADKNMRKLEVGDEISTLFYTSSLYSNSDDIELEVFETFTYQKDSEFDYIALGDGDFMLSFEIYDYQNEVYYPYISVYFEVVDDVIYPELMY